MERNGKCSDSARYTVFMVFISAVCLFVLSLLKATDYAMRDASVIWHGACLVSAMLLYVAGNGLCRRFNMWNITKQLSVVNISMAIIFVLLIFRGRSDLVSVNRQTYLFSFLVIALSCSLAAVINLAGKTGRKEAYRLAERIKEWAQGHRALLLLLLLSLTAALLQSGSEPRWDSAFLYKWLYERHLSTIFNMEGLSFCGHINMAYAAVNIILEFLCGSLALGMTIGNIGLYLGSIACVYEILRILLERDDLECTLLTAVYAVSPFVMGLANYNYWDIWVIFLWPMIIYTVIADKWVYHFILAVVLCFTKEPAVISYGFYGAGLMIVDYAGRRGGIALRGGNVVKQRKYWLMLTIGLIWLYYYAALPNWDGVGAFSIDWKYIREKLNVFYILNFNWLITIACGGLLVYLCLRTPKLTKRILPVMISDIAFVIFSCVFKTINHARYIDTHIATLNLCAITAIGLIGKKGYRYLTAVVLSAIMLFSNYRTWDPLTLLAFDKYHVGNERIMISTAAGEYLSDSMVYNQQYRYFDMALDRAMEDVIMEADKIIIFPRILGRDWFFEGIYAEHNSEDGEFTDEEYWSLKRNKRVLYSEGDHSLISFEIYNMDEGDEIGEILKDKAGYYFYIPCAGKEQLAAIKQQAEVVEEKTFEYNGWTVNRVKVVNASKG